MSSDFGNGGGVSVDEATSRGRPWACLRQFSVFMENRVGNLADLMRQIENLDRCVVGFSIVDTVDCVIVRVVVNNYERAHEVFTLSGLTVFETDVIGVELPEDAQPLFTICRPLLGAEVNIHYAYPLNFRRGRGGVVLHVDSLDDALRALEASGLKIITEHDLLDDHL